MDLPCEVPVMTLPNAILFPQAMLPLYIFEPRYRRMLSDSLASHRMFSVAMQKPGCVREAPCSVAGLGLIRACVSRKDGTSHLVLQGIARVELRETVRYKPYRVHRIRALKSTATDSVAVDALTAKVLELVRAPLQQGFEFAASAPKKKPGQTDESVAADLTLNQITSILDELHDPEKIADLVSWKMVSSPRGRQLLLETTDLERRLKHLIHFLMAEMRPSGEG